MDDFSDEEYKPLGFENQNASSSGLKVGDISEYYSLTKYDAVNEEKVVDKRGKGSESNDGTILTTLEPMKPDYGSSVISEPNWSTFSKSRTEHLATMPVVPNYLFRNQNHLPSAPNNQMFSQMIIPPINITHNFIPLKTSMPMRYPVTQCFSTSSANHQKALHIVPSTTYLSADSCTIPSSPVISKRKLAKQKKLEQKAQERETKKKERERKKEERKQLAQNKRIKRLAERDAENVKNGVVTFPKDTFVVRLKDVDSFNRNNEIWRVDNHILMQKFTGVPSTKSPARQYQSSNRMSGYDFRALWRFYIIKAENVEFDRECSEITIRIFPPIEELRKAKLVAEEKDKEFEDIEMDEYRGKLQLLEKMRQDRKEERAKKRLEKKLKKLDMLKYSENNNKESGENFRKEMGYKIPVKKNQGSEFATKDAKIIDFSSSDDGSSTDDEDSIGYHSESDQYIPQMEIESGLQQKIEVCDIVPEVGFEMTIE